MPSEISLLVTEGPLTGSVFKFKSHETSIIGRGLDCYPCLPDDEGHQTVSRKHCKLYFVGEKVKIKDFGSLNGTYVNGINIGRGESMPHDADTVEIDLQNKDLIRVGSTTLKLQFNSDSICAKCSKPIELDDLNHSDSDKERICRTCYVIEQIEQKQALNASNFNKDRSSLKTDESTPSNLADNLKQFGIDEAVKIDGFEIIRLLGQGGMGSVYLAREQATNNLVALKVILPSVIEDENVVNMFLREASLTSTLNHDNIVRLLETNKQGSSIYFTMEYCDGGSVNKLIHQRGGKIPVDESVDIICQALDGLDYAHNAKVKIQLSDGRIKSSDGMLHRDIKPANIFLKGFGSSKVAKIADMGLSKALDTAGLSGHTRTGSVIGTPFFMPRQLVINFKYAQIDVDVWSMAATLYNMLTGRLPRVFPKDTDPWKVVLEDPLVPIRKRDASIPAKLAEVIDYALVDTPDIVVKSALELKQLIKSSV